MNQYDALKSALMNSSVPTCEYEWKTRPSGSYCTIQLDFEAEQLSADDRHEDIAYQGSIDLYTQGAGMQETGVVESALEAVCGAAWHLNLQAYDSGVQMIHREYVFEVM